MTRPKAAISWSGGKDCCLAMLRAWDSVDIVAMLTMFNEDGERSRSHGLRPAIVAAQAARLELEEFSARCSWDSYTEEYTAMLGRLPERGITHVVFGDIMGDDHRAWNERVCAVHGLTPILPLWAQPTAQLVREFIALGGEARLVTVREPPLDRSWLGLTLTEESVRRLESIGVDPCGEFGEYHTIVTNCPRFSSPLAVVSGESVPRADCWALDMSVELDARIRFAIEHTRLLRLVYLGKTRVVEPHDYGVQKGKEKLLVYQRYEVGTSPRPRTEGWRLLELPKLEACEVLDETFPGSRGDAHQRHYTWDVLYARVK